MNADMRNREDIAFNNRLLEHLRSPGDTVKVAEVLPGDWQKVCVLSAYEKLSRNAAEWLRIKPEEVEVLNGSDTYGTEGYWVLVTIYPPHSVEYHRVKTGVFADFGRHAICPSRDKAVLILDNIFKGAKYLSLRGEE